MDMIREAARRPELEYMFRHVLTQEAAYHTILLKERRHFHKRVGQVMAAIFNETLEEHTPVLAYHFDEAGEHALALGYYRQAGDQAMRLFANQEAVSHFSKAIECLQQLNDPESELRIYLYRQRGRALELVYDYEAADQNYLDMLAIAEEHADQQLELAGLVARTTIHTTFTPKFDQELGIKLAERTMPLARALDDGESQARIYWNLMLTSGFIRSDLWAAVEFGEKSLALCREYALDKQLALTLNDLGRMYSFVGELKRGLPLIQEAGELFKQQENLALLADNYSGQSITRLMTGQLDEAIETGQQGLDLSESTGNTIGMRDGIWRVSHANHERGIFDRALTGLKHLYAEHGDVGDLALAVIPYFVSIHLALGDVERAAQSPRVDEEDQRILLFALLYGAEYIRLDVVQGRLDVARQRLDALRARMSKPAYGWLPLNMPFAWAELLLLSAEGRLQETITQAQDLLSVLAEREQDYYVPQIALTTARALLNLDFPDPAQAEALLRLGRAAAERMQARPFWWEIAAELLRLGPADEHAQWLQEAQDAVAFIADHAPDEDLRRSFLQRVEREAPELQISKQVEP